MANNRPKKGSVLTKEPIRDPAKIEAIKALVADQPRDLALFIMGINSNLRACDLLAVTIGQVEHLQSGDDLVVREKKTGKIRRIVINRAVGQALQDWLRVHPRGRDPFSPLFLSRKGGALKVPTLNNLVKGWCEAVGLAGDFGCHTLRKTFGYQHRVRFGTDLPTLQTLYNHANQKQTLTYLCIQPDEIRSAYMREI